MRRTLRLATDARRKLAPMAAAAATLAALCMLAAGCGGGSSPGTTGDSSAANAASASGGGASSSSGGSSDQLVKFAQCMRANGVPNFPDPQNGRLTIQAGQGGLDPNSPAFQSATQACQSLAPSGLQSGGGQASQADVLKFAKCMRSDGVPDFPDPQVQGNGVVVGQAGSNVNPNSPAFKKAWSKCSHLIMGG